MSNSEEAAVLSLVDNNQTPTQHSAHFLRHFSVHAALVSASVTCLESLTVACNHSSLRPLVCLALPNHTSTLAHPAVAVAMSGVADAKARALEIAQRLAAKIGGGPPASSSFSPTAGSTGGGTDCKHSTLIVQPHARHTLVDSPEPPAG